MLQTTKIYDRISIRKAVSCDVQIIHEVLSDAFEPFKKMYTPSAYKNTVSEPEIIINRLNDKQANVYVTLFENKIVGTFTTIQENHNIHICSMAVKQGYQGKRIGKYLLEEIEKLAARAQCKSITLESFSPLKRAMNLYKKFGFIPTGEIRPYHGIIIFKMIKAIS